jgi:protein-disulfide isomerase
MGGASRNEKKRRQEAAEQRLAAAGIRPPQRTGASRAPLVVVAAVVAVAVVVGLTVLFTRDSGEAVVPAYPVTLSGVVATGGSGPVGVHVYEDYLCPQCERFEERYGDEITTALNSGQITVRYHGVSILDELTDPAGYSTRAANAALCAVPAGIFPAYHATLFDEQPAEGSSGLTDDELIAFGTELGAQGEFAECVRSAPHAAGIAAETEAAAADPDLQTNGNFGTPTVAINGTKIDLNDTSWLQDAIAAG